MLAVDLNGDGAVEYVQLFHPFGVFAREADGWRSMGRVERSGDLRDPRSALEAGDYRTTAPVWKNLRIGGGEYVVVESGKAQAPR
jgi:hypothetical protein